MSMIEPGPRASHVALSRRELLGYAWLTALVALAAVTARAGMRFATPRARPGEFGGELDMGLASELPPPGSAPVSIPAGRFWLVTTDRGFLALHKACTHLDCLCDWDEQNREFVCPCHGSRFAEDGTYLQGPATRSLDRFVVQVKAPTGEIVAETDPASGAPILVAGQNPPQAAGGGAGVAEAEDDEETVDDPAYTVHVDTARKIPGAAPSRR
jgi:cytochrome b6-f complex iron-sulfur subunit